MTFGRQLRLARWAANKTQEQLASDIGTTPARVSLWESGLSIPRLPTLTRVVETLGHGYFLFEVGSFWVAVSRKRGSPDANPGG